jgi:hypothetical protein
MRLATMKTEGPIFEHLPQGNAPLLNLHLAPWELQVLAIFTAVLVLLFILNVVVLRFLDKNNRMGKLLGFKEER